MALNDPVAVYNAANNIEAQLICNLLNDAAIEAYITEDVSTVGVWMFGLLPEIHKPQVWVDRSDIVRVKPLLDEYENQQLQRRQSEEKQRAEDGAMVETTCEECGRQSIFPAAQEDSVQDCPHCGAYMDVGNMSEGEEWWHVSDSGEETEERQ